MPTKEKTVEKTEFGIPLFYERFQEERDKRFSSEIARLEAEIRHNGESISDLKDDIANLRDELKGDIANLRDELKGDIANLRDEISRLDTKIEESVAQLRREMQSQFHWMMSLLLPIILGVVALIIQNLLKP